MRDEEWNEVVEAEKAGKTTEVDANTLQALQRVGELSAELSRQVAQNNAEKYKRQSEIAIAQIEANKETELREIDRYYDERMRQGGTIASQVSSIQEEIAKQMDQSVNAETPEARSAAERNIKIQQEVLNRLLEAHSNEIIGLQNTRIENSKPRNKGLFGLLRDRLRG